MGRTHYVDGHGRDKEVRYFLLTPVGEPRPQNRVDEVRWVTPGEAAELLTHERDREFLARLDYTSRLR